MVLVQLHHVKSEKEDAEVKKFKKHIEQWQEENRQVIYTAQKDTTPICDPSKMAFLYYCCQYVANAVQEE